MGAGSLDLGAELETTPAAGGCTAAPASGAHDVVPAAPPITNEEMRELGADLASRDADLASGLPQ
jgi:hypothetical protein